MDRTAGSEAAVVARGLVKRFGDRAALDGLDLEVPTGCVFGMVGPNGAGKTTTLRLLLDLLRPTAGSLRVFGLDPTTDGVAVRSRVGYLPGELDLPPRRTGREVLADHAAIRRIDTAAAVASLARRLDADLDRPIGQLSLGNRRKIGMIAAFAHRPDLLVLDEPTGGLDPLVQQEFRAMVRETAADGRTVFLSSHVLDEVQHLADRVAVLRAGRTVVVDDMATLLSKVVRTVRVRLAPSTDGAIAALAGVRGVRSAVSTVDGDVELVLEGDAGPLVTALAGLGVVDVDIRRPDLEELVLGYYGVGGR